MTVTQGQFFQGFFFVVGAQLVLLKRHMYMWCVRVPNSKKFFVQQIFKYGDGKALFRICTKMRGIFEAGAG